MPYSFFKRRSIQVCRDTNVLCHTILFCPSGIFPAVSDSEWPPDMLPRFQFGQKRREHIQEALVKETGWNEEMAGTEQRESSLLEEMSVIRPLMKLCNTVSKLMTSNCYMTPLTTSILLWDIITQAEI